MDEIIILRYYDLKVYQFDSNLTLFLAGRNLSESPLSSNKETPTRTGSIDVVSISPTMVL
jgi:hypothetical protein